MKRIDFRSLGVGMVVGVGSLLLLGQTQEKSGVLESTFKSQSIADVFFAHHDKGRQIIQDGTILAPSKLEAEDLPPLVEKGASGMGRYQVIELGDEGAFAIADTQNGIVRFYNAEKDRVTIYSARVPNHVIEEPVRKHLNLVD